VLLDFYVADLCTLGFTICSSYIEQVWPPLLLDISTFIHSFILFGNQTHRKKIHKNKEYNIKQMHRIATQ